MCVYSIVYVTGAGFVLDNSFYKAYNGGISSCFVQYTHSCTMIAEQFQLLLPSYQTENTALARFSFYNRKSDTAKASGPSLISRPSAWLTGSGWWWKGGEAEELKGEAGVNGGSVLESKRVRKIKEKDENPRREKVKNRVGGLRWELKRKETRGITAKSRSRYEANRPRSSPSLERLHRVGNHSYPDTTPSQT